MTTLIFIILYVEKEGKDLDLTSMRKQRSTLIKLIDSRETERERERVGEREGGWKKRKREGESIISVLLH